MARLALEECSPLRILAPFYSWDPGPPLFCAAGRGGVEGKGCATWNVGGMARVCVRVWGGVCGQDEREAAGNCPVGLFVLHPSAGSQGSDTAHERRWSRTSVETCRSGKFKRVSGKAGRNWG